MLLQMQVAIDGEDTIFKESATKIRPSLSASSLNFRPPPAACLVASLLASASFITTLMTVPGLTFRQYFRMGAISLPSLYHSPRTRKLNSLNHKVLIIICISFSLSGFTPVLFYHSSLNSLDMPLFSTCSGVFFISLPYAYPLCFFRIFPFIFVDRPNCLDRLPLKTLIFFSGDYIHLSDLTQFSS